MSLPPYEGPPRRFWEKNNSPYNYKFGLGTVNPEGDWCKGEVCIEPSITECRRLSLSFYTEDLTYFVDEDLLMDVGL
jgi:hypothetical protein